MSYLLEISKNMVLLRQEQNLTQEEVAFRSGLSVSRIQSLEYGCQNTTIDTLIRIAGTFGVDPRVLAIFSRTDRTILSEFRQSPRLPERSGGVLQVCENIVLIRKAEGLTQNQLACLAHISPVCLRDMEHGCSNVTICKLACVAAAFGMSLADLSACSMSEEYLMEMIYTARARAGIRRL